MASRCECYGEDVKAPPAHLDDTAAIADGNGVLCAPVVEVRAFTDGDADKDGLKRCGGPVQTVSNDVNCGRVYKAGTSTPFLATMRLTFGVSSWRGRGGGW